MFFKNKKKGAMTVVAVFVILLLLFMFMALVDITLIGWKMFQTSQTITEVARIGSVQGGFLRKAPDNYPDAYIDISELKNIMDKRMAESGIEEYSLKVAGGRVDSSGNVSPTKRIDYKDEFDLELEYKYDWMLLSGILPKSTTTNLNAVSSRIGMSEWKYNYGSWEGE